MLNRRQRQMCIRDRVFHLGFILLAATPLFDQSAHGQRIYDGPALSFSTLELGWERRSFDDPFLGDADGIHAAFSFAPIPILYFAGDFRYASSEDFLRSDEDIDFLDARLGVGARFTLLGFLAPYIEGGAVYGQLDRPGSRDGYDGVGFYVEPGLKLGLFGRLEASVAGEMTVLDDTTFFGGKAGLMLGITDHFGIGVDAGISEHSDYFGVGVRFSW